MGKISVIIPIYNAEVYLSTLFKCLDKCNFESGDEVLLVDNGSTDCSVELCEQQYMRNPNLYKCLSFTKSSGSYAARNYAVNYAKGDILVFTDSDCMPSPEWIDAIRGEVKKGVVIAGKVEIQILDNGLWECFDAIAHLRSEENAANNLVATANMSVSKEDFIGNGKFEERFSGGDYEWSNRAKNNGLSIKYVPEALVYHPSRKSFSQILKKEQRIAYGVGMHHRIHKKSILKLILIYLLKILKIDTNIRYTIQLKKKGIKLKDLLIFNMSFFKIRFEQVKYVYRGYKNIDVRKLDLK